MDSKKRKANVLGSYSGDDDDDDDDDVGLDARLARRWKRKQIASRYFKAIVNKKDGISQQHNKPPINYILVDQEEEEGELDVLVDLDYQKYLNDVVSSRLYCDRNVDSDYEALLLSRHIEANVANCYVTNRKDGNGDVMSGDDDCIYIRSVDHIPDAVPAGDGNANVNFMGNGTVDPTVSESVETVHGFSNDGIVDTRNDGNVDSRSHDICFVEGSIDSDIAGAEVPDEGNHVAGKFGNGDGVNILNDCTLYDPQYKTFLENVTKCGQGYVFRSFSGNKVLEITYEVDDWHNVEDQETIKENPKRVNIITNKLFRTGSSRQRMETRSDEWSEKMKTQRNLKNAAGERIKSSAIERKLKKGAVDHTSCPTNRIYEVERDMIDEGYQRFLNSMMNKENSETGVYHSESLSDPEVVVLNTDPFSNEIETQTQPVEDGEGLLYFGTDRKFRKELMEILKKPYDEEEYKHLWRQASCRKPKNRIRVFRGDTKVCPTQEVGRSYLDNESDLEEKIKLAQHSRPKTLNLLRGYFFWLQNAAHPGVFKPWLDSFCLEVQPHCH